MGQNILCLHTANWLKQYFQQLPTEKASLALPISVYLLLLLPIASWILRNPPHGFRVYRSKKSLQSYTETKHVKEAIPSPTLHQGGHVAAMFPWTTDCRTQGQRLPQLPCFLNPASPPAAHREGGALCIPRWLFQQWQAGVSTQPGSLHSAAAWADSLTWHHLPNCSPSMAEMQEPLCAVEAVYVLHPTLPSLHWSHLL